LDSKRSREESRDRGIFESLVGPIPPSPSFIIFDLLRRRSWTKGAPISCSQVSEARGSSWPVISCPKSFVKSDGKVVMNDHRINPPAVNLGEMEYPKAIPETIHSKIKGFYLIKGTDIAFQLEGVRAANGVLLGAISKFFEVTEDFWLKTILDYLPSKVHELNRKAFSAGRDQIHPSVRN